MAQHSDLSLLQMERIRTLFKQKSPTIVRLVIPLGLAQPHKIPHSTLSLLQIEPGFEPQHLI